MKRINATVSYRGWATVAVTVPDKYTMDDVKEAASADIEIPMDAEIDDVLDIEDDDEG